MTGYLHIPEPPADSLREQIASRLRGSFYSSWREGASIDLASYDAADILLDFLRGLSVEPTEDDRSPARCRAYAAVLMGVVPELDDLESAELVTARAMQWEAEAERPLVAPVPVQEDRP